uniref:C2H2-type domain-containing protein n=1 Tax=Syphacia muris TaxID=451379 RepID=A0A158R662_9BILA
MAKVMRVTRLQKNESTSDSKLEDIGSEIVQQASDDSSPSPSDSSNNVDDFTFNVNDLAEKPFTCEHANCHKRFANKFLLKKHQFIHTGLRPHCCPFCGKRFNRKDNLLRHKKTHSTPMDRFLLLTNDLKAKKFQGTDMSNALSTDFLLQLSAEKPIIKIDNEQEEEEEL